MAYAPTPRFTKEDSNPIVIQNKMPKQGETDVTGSIPGGGGAGSAFRLVTSPGTSTAPTTSNSSNPYPVGYTSGMPKGLDTVSGPGASYTPGSGSGSTPAGVTQVANSVQQPGLLSDTSPWQYKNETGGSWAGQSSTGQPVYTGESLTVGTGGMPVQSGTNAMYRAGGANSTTDAANTTQTGPYRNLGSSAIPYLGQRPPGIDQSSWSMFLATPAGQQYMANNPPSGGGGGGGGATAGNQHPGLNPGRPSGPPIRNPDLPIPRGGGANAMYSSGNGGGYLGPPVQVPPQGQWQGQGQGIESPYGTAVINRDRIMGWHSGPGAWSHNPGRGPLGPTWMGGGYNPWTGEGGGTAPPWVPGSQGGGGGSAPPPPSGGGQPPWIPSDPQSPGGGNDLRSFPPSRPPGGGTRFMSNGMENSMGGGPSPNKMTIKFPGVWEPPTGPPPLPPPPPPAGRMGSVGYGSPESYMAGRTGIQRDNPEGYQRGWRYGGRELNNDQLPPVGGGNQTGGQQSRVGDGGGYLGPPVQQGFPTFDFNNPPSPQQLLEMVQNWYEQFVAQNGGRENPAFPPGVMPQNPIQNPTWGAPWPGWNRGNP